MHATLQSAAREHATRIIKVRVLCFIGSLLHPNRIGEIAAVLSRALRVLPLADAKLGSLLLSVLDPADRLHIRTLFSRRGTVFPQIGYVYLVDITPLALSYFLWPSRPTTFVKHGAYYQSAFDALSCLSLFLC